MSVKKPFLKDFEKSSACMSQQKGYRLLKEGFLFHTPFPLHFRESKTGVCIRSVPPFQLSVCPLSLSITA